MSDYGIYDDIFAEKKSYNTGRGEDYKFLFTLGWVDNNNISEILDVGCGRGNYVELLTKNDVRVTAFDPSRYLTQVVKGFDIINDDIMSFAAKTDRKWPALICMDVLEHIDPVLIEKNVRALTSLSDRSLIGIANSEEVWKGVPLHLIRRSQPWWQDLLSRHYHNVKCLYRTPSYFIFEAIS
ncbi:hypothetical protein A3A68_01760 [Candidatus Saccharibacteria bacterium RIFCSPLOWO2_01_FULL_48_13]|nr:MAG: hypothetical protein A3F38_00405 [Candidatus Saccharibacteria bacterium RIFCSPHIGHO2_12_FULL_48_21]OGL36875.1 MAG: hypothetical protein A3A68_01760 [Candidatus Saccharibacteria bacterium RIFCSPLOWO2_01_FULL_48_13]